MRYTIARATCQCRFRLVVFFSRFLLCVAAIAGVKGLLWIEIEVQIPLPPIKTTILSFLFALALSVRRRESSAFQLFVSGDRAICETPARKA